MYIFLIFYCLNAGSGFPVPDSASDKSCESQQILGWSTLAELSPSLDPSDAKCSNQLAEMSERNDIPGTLF